MMAAINIGAVLEYGRPGGVLRKIGVVGPAREGDSSSATVGDVAKKNLVPSTHLVERNVRMRRWTDDFMDVDGEDEDTHELSGGSNEDS